jgi:hypothetical protein
MVATILIRKSYAHWRALLVVSTLPITCLDSSLPAVQFAPVEAALLHSKQRDPYPPETIVP